MTRFSWWLCIFIPIVWTGCVSHRVQRDALPFVRGLHVIHFETDQDLEKLGEQIPLLAEQGVNTLFLEVNYAFNYQSHPELRMGESPITREGARRLARICRRNHVRLIPQFQCLGHQSWKEKTFPLLLAYPEFDLTPGAYPNNKDIYCREWDPTNPRVHPMIFELIGELIDAFQADAFHVGMDEVFLLGDPNSPTTKGKDPAVLFAKAVKEFHQFLVVEKGVEMYMWGDRLIDGKALNMGSWEAAENGTAPAISMIPKDIVICPWHYELRETYPSLDVFLEHGFRILPASWKNMEAGEAFIRYGQSLNSPNLLGHVFTTWGSVKGPLSQYPPLVEGLKLLPPE